MLISSKDGTNLKISISELLPVLFCEHNIVAVVLHLRINSITTANCVLFSVDVLSVSLNFFYGKLGCFCDIFLVL